MSIDRDLKTITGPTEQAVSDAFHLFYPRGYPVSEPAPQPFEPDEKRVMDHCRFILSFPDPNVDIDLWITRDLPKLFQDTCSMFATYRFNRYLATFDFYSELLVAHKYVQTDRPEGTVVAYPKEPLPSADQIIMSAKDKVLPLLRTMYTQWSEKKHHHAPDDNPKFPEIITLLREAVERFLSHQEIQYIAKKAMRKQMEDAAEKEVFLAAQNQTLSLRDKQFILKLLEEDSSIVAPSVAALAQSEESVSFATLGQAIQNDWDACKNLVRTNNSHNPVCVVTLKFFVRLQTILFTTNKMETPLEL